MTRVTHYTTAYVNSPSRETERRETCLRGEYWSFHGFDEWEVRAAPVDGKLYRSMVSVTRYFSAARHLAMFSICLAIYPEPPFDGYFNRLHMYTHTQSQTTIRIAGINRITINRYHYDFGARKTRFGGATAIKIPPSIGLLVQQVN